jgi:hypothetical protein
MWLPELDDLLTIRFVEEAAHIQGQIDMGASPLGR